MTDEIRDGAYVAVGGKVARVFQTKNGAALELHVQTERMKYPDRYTVWGCGDEVAEGDRVEIRGWLETQPETFTKRDGTEGHGVKRTINAPKLTKHEPAQQDTWSGGDDSPF